MVDLEDHVVKDELARMEQDPVSAEERKVACRAIVRWKGSKACGVNEEDGSPIGMTEDWVRLYVALRRGSGGQPMRMSAAHLRRWKARVSSSTTVKRKVFIVRKAALLDLPVYPEDLQSWVIPRGHLDLPADIYGDDVLFIDDGYDRSKLRVPGLLHLEVAVKWAREHSNAPPRDGADDRGMAARAPALPEPPAAPALAAELPKRPIAAAQAVERPAVAAPETGESEKAMTDIVAQTVKALGLGRWVSTDPSLPNTAEFWVRLFANDITKEPKRGDKVNGAPERIRQIHHEGALRKRDWLPQSVRHGAALSQNAAVVFGYCAAASYSLH